MRALKPTWSSSAFLLYAGWLAVLIAAAFGLEVTAGGYGAGAFVGWSALVLVVLALLAERFRRFERPVAAGLFAFLAVAAFGVFVGALEDWWGWLPENWSPFDGFPSGLLLLEFALLAAGFFAIRRFHFSLIVLALAATSWFLVTDVVSSGGDWSAVVTLLVGFAFLGIGRSLDRGPRRPYGFWMHVASGLLIGGSLLYWLNDSDADWALIAVAGLAYVAMAAPLKRSSWAVLGAVGLLLSAVYFAGQWSNEPDFFFSGLGDGDYEEGRRPWVWAVVLAFLGFLYVALGLLLERRRRVVAEP